MPLTESGRTLIAASLMADPLVDALDVANAFLGIGDSAAAFAITQTDLQASTNKLRGAMQPGFPARTGNVIRYRAVFAEAEANFAWNEWGLFNAASGGLMLNRKVRDLGTKPNTETWQLFVAISIEIGA